MLNASHSALTSLSCCEWGVFGDRDHTLIFPCHRDRSKYRWRARTHQRRSRSSRLARREMWERWRRLGPTCLRTSCWNPHCECSYLASSLSPSTDFLRRAAPTTTLFARCSRQGLPYRQTTSSSLLNSQTMEDLNRCVKRSHLAASAPILGLSLTLLPSLAVVSVIPTRMRRVLIVLPGRLVSVFL